MKKVLYLFAICGLLAACGTAHATSPPDAPGVQIVVTDNFSYDVAPMVVTAPFAFDVITITSLLMTGQEAAVICCNGPDIQALAVASAGDCCNETDFITSSQKNKNVSIENCYNGYISVSNNYSWRIYNTTAPPEPLYALRE